VTGSGMLLVFSGMCVVAGIAVYQMWQRIQRRKQLQGFAASMGWTYRDSDPSLATRWHGYPFDQGFDRSAHTVVTGTNRGVPFVCLDYRYVTKDNSSRGSARTTHHVAVVAVALPTWLPGLQVRPEDALHRAVESVGIGVGVQLESEDFNRRFVVTAHDPKFASDVLTPRTMQALLAAPPLAWRIDGSDLVSWSTGACGPTQLLQRLATLSAVVTGIPAFVWHDNGYQGQPAQGSSS
jgi:hypothetical protein